MKVTTYLKELKRISEISVHDIEKYPKDIQSLIYSIRGDIENGLGEIDDIQSQPEYDLKTEIDWLQLLPKEIKHNNKVYKLTRDVGDTVYTVIIQYVCQEMENTWYRLECAGICGSTNNIQYIAKELYNMIVRQKYIKPFKGYWEYLE